MKQKTPRIAATLKYGPFQPLFVIVLMRILFYLSVFLFGISAIVLLLSLFGVMEAEDGAFGLMAMPFSLLLSGIPLIFLIPHATIKRKVRLWLKDAVPLTAQSQTAAVRTVYARVTYRVAKISVKFFYNGEKYIRASGNPEKNKELNGFSKYYWDYTDREIKILYSPTYDQVMILWEDKLNSK